MSRIVMSPAASARLRCPIGHARVLRDRILLTHVVFLDWCSLTSSGERHEFDLRIPGPSSPVFWNGCATASSDAEFSIPGVIVADVAAGAPAFAPKGSTTIETLTVTAG